MKMLALLFAIASLAACSDQTPATDTATPDATSAVDATPPADHARDGNDADASPGSAMPSDPAGNAGLEADYLGRWTGVEGMYLEVASKPGGGVTLDMQWDLDNKDTFDGSVTAEGLRFMRNGVAESAVRTDGAATGLKYLADKQDCLTVKPGEGYCRD